MNIYVKLLQQVVEKLTQLDDVLDYLLSGGHITTINRETIKSETKESDSIRKMLDILQKRNCSPNKFQYILSKTGNEQLTKLFQQEMGKETVQEKLMPQTIDKRKIFILEGLNQDEILDERFSGSNPNWEVTFVLDSLKKLMEKIAKIPENKYRYLDIIVVCNDEYEDITNQSLKTMIPYIEKQILTKFPPSIITFLIIVKENDDNGYIFHPNTKPDSQPLKPIFRILKKKFLQEFMEAFLESKETFNIFVGKKFHKEKELIDENPIEEKADRQIFIQEGFEQDEILHNYFRESNLNCVVTPVFGTLNTIMAKIAKIPENKYRYLDIIVVCNDEYEDITNQSLKTMIPSIEKQILLTLPPSIITFLIIVNENDDNGYIFHPDTKPVSIGDAQISKPVFRVLRKKFFHEFMRAFFSCEEMFNIFIKKTFHTEKELVDKKPIEEKSDKRKIFILEGLEQDDKLHNYFRESHPYCEVTPVFGTLNRIMDQIASIPKNTYRYFDIIVLSNEESLQTMLSYIKNKMLPRIQTSIITFLIIVDEKNDNGTECQPLNKIDFPDSRALLKFHSLNRNDLQESQHVIASLKREFWNGFLDDFIKSKEMLNIFIDKKPIEETPDERKIFILEGLEQDDKLDNYFQESHPDCEVTYVLGTLNRIGDEIAKIPENTYRYFDIIVLSNEESLQTMLSYIKNKMLPKFPPSIITFLIIVDEKNDNGTECQPPNKIDLPDARPVNRNDIQESQHVIASLKREFWNGFLDDFIKSKEMLNIFIRKADTRKHLRFHV